MSCTRTRLLWCRITYTKMKHNTILSKAFKSKAWRPTHYSQKVKQLGWCSKERIRPTGVQDNVSTTNTHTTKPTVGLIKSWLKQNPNNSSSQTQKLTIHEYKSLRGFKKEVTTELCHYTQSWVVLREARWLQVF